MTSKQVSEIVWKFYQSGRPSSTAQQLSQKDIEQFVLFGYGSFLRKKFYEEPGTDFYADALDTREYDLGEMMANGMRRALIKDDVVRLPRNADVVNVYPIGSCSGNEVQEITQVQPGEETFYFSADFASFQFFVQKGKGINTYHVPLCVKKLQVERIYVSDDLDIPLDVAYDIALQVLQVSLKVKEFIPTADNSFDANKNQLRYNLEQAGKKV